MFDYLYNVLWYMDRFQILIITFCIDYNNFAYSWFIQVLWQHLLWHWKYANAILFVFSTCCTIKLWVLFSTNPGESNLPWFKRLWNTLLYRTMRTYNFCLMSCVTFWFQSKSCQLLFRQHQLKMTTPCSGIKNLAQG